MALAEQQVKSGHKVKIVTLNKNYQSGQKIESSLLLDNGIDIKLYGPEWNR